MYQGKVSKFSETTKSFCDKNFPQQKYASVHLPEFKNQNSFHRKIDRECSIRRQENSN